MYGYIFDNPTFPSEEEIKEINRTIGVAVSANHTVDDWLSGESGDETPKLENLTETVRVKRHLYRPETFLDVRCDLHNGFFDSQRKETKEEDAGPEKIRCIDGGFSAITTLCRRPCPDLGSYFQSLGYRIERYQVTCAEGHHPYSGNIPQTIYCSNGTWSLINLRCEPKCEPFYKAMWKSSNHIFGYIDKFGVYAQPYVMLGNIFTDIPGDDVTVTCNEGFQVVWGSEADFQRLVCVGAKWTQLSMICERPCPVPFYSPISFDPRWNLKKPAYDILPGPHGNLLPVPSRSYQILRCGSQELWESFENIGSYEPPGGRYFAPGTAFKLQCGGNARAYPLESSSQEVYCARGSFDAPTFSCMRPWDIESFDFKNFITIFVIVAILLFCTFAAVKLQMWTIFGVCAAPFVLSFVWWTWFMWSPTVSTSYVETYAYACLKCDRPIEHRPRADEGRPLPWGRSVIFEPYPKPLSEIGSKRFNNPRPSWSVLCTEAFRGGFMPGRLMKVSPSFAEFLWDWGIRPWAEFMQWTQENGGTSEGPDGEKGEETGEEGRSGSFSVSLLGGAFLFWSIAPLTFALGVLRILMERAVSCFSGSFSVGEGRSTPPVPSEDSSASSPSASGWPASERRDGQDSEREGEESGCPCKDAEWQETRTPPQSLAASSREESEPPREREAWEFEGERMGSSESFGWGEGAVDREVIERRAPMMPHCSCCADCATSPERPRGSQEKPVRESEEGGRLPLGSRQNPVQEKTESGTVTWVSLERWTSVVGAIVGSLFSPIHSSASLHAKREGRPRPPEIPDLFVLAGGLVLIVAVVWVLRLRSLRDLRQRPLSSKKNGEYGQ
uniref:Sushi domain-containing protein n=1 Tax=Chromera velia CCMP2878 TaxID=1169474 RepID=A0A0G4H476_9ALVE|eukprot:Cvel_5677.t1-p1 / transcript=Cvel_5677.t1 / gene=Cvel_5677 / organism=Chromera_velia_CCMP2878 / gene_product=hypothetical protein / transcript_product=hypothetical protein / location=Cvel_scaffold268:22955-32618(+) / protein_length=839 / sequence_SO=supercontig / SO=protein_coding / is_pseudo=false